ncbi:MAG TPA: 8-amino-7-oxononanoate synthase [Acidobacteriota bacterium]|nr:8-amino-7-oxononanoate synthase [Acidobacteriota bacterium]
MWWEQAIQWFEAEDLRRRLSPGSPEGPYLVRDGRRLLNLSSNDYLGLSTDRRLLEAARRALEEWGIGAGASRLIAGDRPVHAKLEETLAAAKGTEAALVFSSGYAACVGALSALTAPGDQVFLDALCHASLYDGARLSHARLRRYRHRDPAHLETLINRYADRKGRRFLVTDAVFSMDGTLAPLAELVDLAEEYRLFLVVDDAHGTGIIGPEGRGTLHYLGLADRVPLQLVTLSKALGTQGGAAVGASSLVEFLVHRARSFVYSTGLAPPVASAAIEALRLVAAPEGEERRRHQQDLVERLKIGLASLGYAVRHEEPAPMLAVLLGSPGEALRLSRALEEGGVVAPAIRPPTVPPGTSRIRLSPMATQSFDDIDSALAVFPPADNRRRERKAQ